jgi:hypothetical protein
MKIFVLVEIEEMIDWYWTLKMLLQHQHIWIFAGPSIRVETGRIMDKSAYTYFSPIGIVHKSELKRHQVKENTFRRSIKDLCAVRRYFWRDVKDQIDVFGLICLFIKFTITQVRTYRIFVLRGVLCWGFIAPSSTEKLELIDNSYFTDDHLPCLFAFVYSGFRGESTNLGRKSKF